MQTGILNIYGFHDLNLSTICCHQNLHDCLANFLSPAALYFTFILRTLYLKIDWLVFCVLKYQVCWFSHSVTKIVFDCHDPSYNFFVYFAAIFAMNPFLVPSMVLHSLHIAFVQRFISNSKCSFSNFGIINYLIMSVHLYHRNRERKLWITQFDQWTQALILKEQLVSNHLNRYGCLISVY